MTSAHDNPVLEMYAMISSFDRAIGWTCLGAAFALAACGGATNSPETVHDASADGMSTTHHDGSSPTDSGKKTDAPATDAKTGPKDGGTINDGGAPTDATPTTDAAACPATEPMNRSACTTMGDTCTYAGADCACTMGGMGTLEWRCAVPCPTTAPTVGSACTGGGGMGGGHQVCTFGTLDCACTGGMWACDTCPTTEPTVGAACTLGGELCGYDAGSCRCSGNGGGMPPTDAATTGDAAAPPAEAWQCGGACPATQPAANSACTTVTGQLCTYGTTTCDCFGGTFHCQ
jgi:hypothetical protein